MDAHRPGPPFAAIQTLSFTEDVHVKSLMRENGSLLSQFSSLYRDTNPVYFLLKETASPNVPYQEKEDHHQHEQQVP